jgi:hypothetical protein
LIQFVFYRLLLTFFKPFLNHAKAAVAFGANPAGFSHQMMGRPPPQQYNPYFAHHHPQAAAMANASVAGHYPPHAGVRTYTSLEDVGPSDDESSQDQF